MFILYSELVFRWHTFTLPRREKLLFIFYASEKILKTVRKELVNERRLLGSMAGKYGSHGLFVYTLQNISWYESQERRWEKRQKKVCRDMGFVPTEKFESELERWLEEGRPRARGA